MFLNSGKNIKIGIMDDKLFDIVAVLEDSTEVKTLNTDETVEFIDRANFYDIAKKIETEISSESISVSERFDCSKFIDNVCLSCRHDFGLMDETEREKLRFECKEWMRAIKNNEKY